MKPGEPVSKNDAAVLLRAVQRKLDKPLIMRDIQPAVWITRRQADRERAMRMIEAEMLASVARCDALERALGVVSGE